MQAEIQVHERCECRCRVNAAEKRQGSGRKSWLAAVLVALMLAALPAASAGMAALFAAGGVRAFAATVQTDGGSFSVDALAFEGAAYLCKDALMEGLPLALARRVQTIPGRFYGTEEFVPASALTSVGIALAM